MMPTLFKFLFSTLIFASTYSLDPTPETQQFWLTTNLLSIDWKPGCLTTAFCHAPKFQLTHSTHLEKEAQENVLINWPISGDFLQDQSSSFMTHWTKGSPEDVSLACQVVGTDPTFGFARVCDESVAVKVFKKTQIYTSQQNPSFEEAHMIVEVRGKCFNATLAVQKHTQRCPWCPDPSLEIHSEEQMPSDPHLQSSSLLTRLNEQEQFVQMCVFIGLASVTAISTTCCAILLILYFKQKKRTYASHPYSNSNKQLPYNCMIPSDVHPYHQVVEPKHVKIIGGKHDDSYETPWNSKYPLLSNVHHSTSSGNHSIRSGSSTISPLTSTSALGSSIYEQTSDSSLLGRLHLQKPPTTVLDMSVVTETKQEDEKNDSFGSKMDKSDDSGLETV